MNESMHTINEFRFRWYSGNLFNSLGFDTMLVKLPNNKYAINIFSLRDSKAYNITYTSIQSLCKKRKLV